MNLDQFRYYTDWHSFVNEKRYDKPAAPWDLLRVNSASVGHYNPEIRLNWGLGRIEAGDWDREDNCIPLDEITIYRGLTQRFENGFDWEETALYQRAKEAFETDGRFRGYNNLAAYTDVRCKYVDELFHSIKRDGYRPNREATHEKPTQDNPFEDAYAHHLEPLVVIGRSGEIYWCEGLHRFTIASILDIDEVPVSVLCRHKHWQQTRDRVYNALTSDHLSELEISLDHPDLQDVLP